MILNFNCIDTRIDKTDIVLYKVWTLDSLYISYTQVLNVCREWQHSVTWKVCSPTVTSHMEAASIDFAVEASIFGDETVGGEYFELVCACASHCPWASNIPLIFYFRYFIPLPPPIFVAQNLNFPNQATNLNIQVTKIELSLSSQYDLY